MTTTEIWATIPDYDGRYAINRAGQVLSVPREIAHLNRWGKFQTRTIGGHYKKPFKGCVSLWQDSAVRWHSVAKLVRQCFPDDTSDKTAS